MLCVTPTRLQAIARREHSLLAWLNYHGQSDKPVCANGATQHQICSLSRLLLGLGGSVGESHVKLLSSGDDSQSVVMVRKKQNEFNLPLLGGDSLADLAAVDSVVHEEHLNVRLVGDKHLLEAIRKSMSSGLGLLVTNLWHLSSASESTTG